MTTTRSARPAGDARRTPHQVSRPAHRPHRVRPSAADVVAAAGAAVVLVVLLVGPPLLLTTAAPSPLPAHLSARAFTQALQAPVSDGLLLRLLAAIAWAAWLWQLAATGVAVATAASGVTWRLPGGGGAPQRAAHALVGLIVLALPLPAAASSTGLTRAPAAAPSGVATMPLSSWAPGSVSPPTSRELPRPSPDLSRAAGDTVAAAATAMQEPPAVRPVPTATAGAPELYVVQPPHGRTHDTLWDIAARELGDPLRWREIYQLNAHRVMPDGSRFTDAHWIRPGWTLHLPASAALGQVTQAHPPITPPHQRAAAPPEPGSAAAPTSTAPSGALPPAPAPAATTPSPTVTATPATSHEKPSRDPDLAWAGLTGLGAAAVAALAVLDRRRRVSSRRRPLGTRPTPPAEDLRAAETALRRDAADWAGHRNAVDEVLRLAALRAPGVTVRAVWVTSDGAVELDTVPAQPVPLPFVTQGTRWRLAASERNYRHLLDRDAAAPFPGVAPVGADSTGVCWVNLAGQRTFAISGDDPTAVGALLRQLAEGLAAAPWFLAGEVHVPPALAARALPLDRLTSTDVPADVLRAHDPDTGPDLAFIGYPPDALPPDTADRARVVVAAPGPDSAGTGDAARHLVDAVPLRVEAGALRAPFLPEPLRLPPAQTDQRDAVLTALTGSRHEQFQPAPLTPPAPTEAGEGGTPTDLDAPAPAQSADAGPDAAPKTDAADTAPARVLLLGPVEIHGRRRITRSQVRDMAVHLACEPAGASPVALAETLWPDRAYNADAFRNRLSDLNATLGAHRDPHGRIQLSPEVTSDWAEFQALARGDEQQRRQALALVRGRPFADYDREWIHTSGIARHVEAAVVDLAVDVAQRALDRGDPTAARDAALAGIKACPYDERLYRLAISAAEQRGAPGEARALMRDLRLVVEDEIEPEDTVEAATQAAFERAIRSPGLVRPGVIRDSASG